jgi:hypothetical protein
MRMTPRDSEADRGVDAAATAEVVADTDDHRYLINDRDRIFAKHLDDSIRALGLAILRSPLASPKANAICERVIGTIRRECLDRMTRCPRRIYARSCASGSLATVLSQ